MTECINVYRATQSIARSLLSCGVRLSVCLARWCIETAKLTIKRFSTSISEIPIPIPNTEVFQNTDTEYRTHMKKIPNTDTDSKYRYRPSSNLYTCQSQWSFRKILILVICILSVYSLLTRNTFCGTRVPVGPIAKISKIMSSFIRSKVTLALFIIHRPLCSIRYGRSTKTKTKCVASSGQKLLRGSQNYVVGLLASHGGWPIQQRNKNDRSV